VGVSRVVVHIERLVLRGVASGAEKAIAAGLQRELQRLLASPAGCGHWARAAEAARLRLGPLPPAAATSPFALGVHAARGIDHALRSQTRGKRDG